MNNSSPRKQQTSSVLAQKSSTPGSATSKKPSAPTNTTGRTSSPRSEGRSSLLRAAASENRKQSPGRGHEKSPPASIAEPAFVRAISAPISLRSSLSSSDHVHENSRPSHPTHRTKRGTSSQTAAQVQPVQDRSATLWDKACSSLREKGSKHLLILETVLERFEREGTAASIPEMIGQLVQQRQAKVLSNDEASTNILRQTLSRIASFMTTMRPAALGLPQLLRISGVDSLRIAPVVLGGVYTLVEILQNDRRESLTAMPALINVAEMIAFWKCIETRQIKKNHDPGLTGLYKNLGSSIVKLYELAIGLLGTMIAYFDRTRMREFNSNLTLVQTLMFAKDQLLGALLPAHEEWTELRSRVKAQEEVCKTIKDQVTTHKERQECESKILNAVSSHDILGSYRALSEHTGVVRRYRNACQWIFEQPEFSQWLTHQKSAVLWLNGNAGTGKTTAMIRVICELRQSLEMCEKRCAFFFFRKAGTASDSLLNVETCLRSLVRQLSWKDSDAEVESVTERKYNEIKMQRRPDDSLSAGECLSLLKQLTSAKETYLLIDGVDECEDPTGLLRELKKLILHAKNDNQSWQPRGSGNKWPTSGHEFCEHKNSLSITPG